MWRDRQNHPVRQEAHYTDRVIPCFTNRPVNLSEILHTNAKLFPNEPALIGEEGTITHAALSDKAHRIGNGLIAKGVKPGDRVAMLVGNRFAFAEVLAACWTIGAIFLPMNPLMRAQEIEFVLNQSKATAVVYDKEFAANLPDRNSTPSVNHWIEAYGNNTYEALAKHEPTTPFTQSETDTSALLYTSGTTGRPKGAKLTHLSIIHGALQLAYGLEMTEQSRMLLASPASHVTGLVGNIIAAWSVGAGVVFMRAFKAQKALSAIETEGVSHTLMAPAMYKLCLLAPDIDQYNLSSWRYGAYGGAPMPEADIAALSIAVPNLGLINTYGATEASSGHTALPASLAASHRTSVGGALHCSQILIMNDDGTEVATGETGEIWMKGGNVIPGYWDNPEANAANFVGGYWKSGDIGRMDQDGLIYVMDRKKDMLNRGGYKIYSSEVENQLSFHPAITECAVIAKPCEVLGERVRAVVVIHPNKFDLDQTLATDIQAFAAKHLSEYKVPEDIIFRDTPLPRNANGKILKNLLREEYAHNEQL